MAGHVAYFLGRASLVTALFCAVYGLCDLVTGSHGVRLRVHMDWELAIPFVAWTTVVYSSVYLMFPFTPFVLTTRDALDRFARALALQILAAGIFFVALPAEPAYPPGARDLGVWAPAFVAADTVNLRYNMVPSLHVALAVSCALVFAPAVGRGARYALAVWALAVSVATLTTHQHHLVDVVAGIALAFGAVRATQAASTISREAPDAVNSAV